MLSQKSQNLLSRLNDEIKFGDIKKIAKEIKKDHEVAMELWSTQKFHPRILSVLIMDKALLTQEVLDGLSKDLQKHPLKERNHISDWLLANQLMKSKKTKALLESWEDSPYTTQRRLFWYYQARLRWTGQTPPDNTNALMESLEKNLASEDPEVQWAMNFAAGQIGIFDPEYRERCSQLGEKTGLYKDEVVPKNCTPNYLPEFIRIEVEKRK
tara:strand:+ start:168 stop:803 length:636 start_codon:yes stop_codon:yes gene_type:complete